MSLFRNATFVLSAHEVEELPPPGAPEIAFAGRSNAGKSSAINALAHQKRLAFVSKTPGRTQLINFFRLSGGGLLVDLPGYGYARVPATVQRHWRKLVSGYLQTRKSLLGLVLVMDARHPLTPLDETMLSWFKPTAKPVHVLLTKADKLSRGPAQRTLRDVRARLAELAPNFTAQLFSALNRTGIEAAEEVLGAWLDPGSDVLSQGPGQKSPEKGLPISGLEQKSPELKGKARGRTP